mmetsp:Transcript_85598/g.245716  ORF Transcript_85598/g.245716 Transcript_85598/m.245716 type:complete len:97 (+) Transcript_85598:64-354(+)
MNENCNCGADVKSYSGAGDQQQQILRGRFEQLPLCCHQSTWTCRANIEICNCRPAAWPSGGAACKMQNSRAHSHVSKMWKTRSASNVMISTQGKFC